jgi:hypothetical protein
MGVDSKMLVSILVVLIFAAVFPLALYDYCKDWINYLRKQNKQALYFDSVLQIGDIKSKYIFLNKKLNNVR